MRLHSNLCVAAHLASLYFVICAAGPSAPLALVQNRTQIQRVVFLLRIVQWVCSSPPCSCSEQNTDSAFCVLVAHCAVSLFTFLSSVSSSIKSPPFLLLRTQSLTGVAPAHTNPDGHGYHSSPPLRGTVSPTCGLCLCVRHRIMPTGKNSRGGQQKSPVCTFVTRFLFAGGSPCTRQFSWRLPAWPSPSAARCSLLTDSIAGGWMCRHPRYRALRLSQKVR